MSDITDDRLKQLEDKVASLSSLVEKQSQIIANTGQQLMEFQVNNVKAKMNQLDSKSASDIDLSDYVTNDDIVQLVGELSGQLDALEDRNISRIYNIQLTKNDSTKKIAPLTNKEGELPSIDLFPNSVGEFLSINDIQLLQLCEFYELIISSEDKNNINQFIEQGNIPFEEAQKLLQGISANNDIEKKVSEFTPEQINELHDELCRFLGLNFRRSEGLW